jgi:hypothetical protein
VVEQRHTLGKSDLSFVFLLYTNGCILWEGRGRKEGKGREKKAKEG